MIMTNAIYITTTEPRCGKSLVSLGIANILLRKTGRVAVFRPIIDAEAAGQPDKNIELLLSYFNLKTPYEDTYAFLEHEALALLGRGEYDTFMDRIIQKYKHLESRCDYIMVIGSDFESDEAAIEFDLNARIAQTLGIPALVVSRADRLGPAEALSAIRVMLDSFAGMGCQAAGVIVNRATPENVAELTAVLQENVAREDRFVFVIPADERLSSPTIREVAEQLDAEVLYGEEHLDWLAYRNLIIAMRVRHYLSHLSRNALLITAGDRNDVLLSALQAHRSQNYPRLAGIVLTGGLKPPEPVALLLEGLGELVPILSVRTDTYDTAALASNIRSYITADNWAKINLSLKLFEEYVDTAVLEAHLGRIQAAGMTPRMFLYSLMQKAKADKKRIVLPEGTDERILRAAEILLNRGIVDLVLLGDPPEVRKQIRRLGLNVNLDEAPVIDPRASPKLDEYAETLYELRRDRGLPLDSARDLMQDAAYYGTMMVYKGDADGMVSGAAHTTAHTIRPALQFIKTKPGFSVVSSVFFMALDDRVLVYGDCAVVPNPTAEQLAEIAVSSADTARTFGIEPRVAMLSYSTGASGSGADVEKVRRAAKLARARRPDLILEGPMQYDAAVSPEVAAAKMPGSRVAGRATVLIFPDLNTGNNTYKAVQRETGAIAIGPTLQGLKKPVNDLSRGCTVEDVVNTVAITAIQAQEEG